MKTRAVLGLAIVAGMATAASAQTVTFTWNWNRASDPFGTPAPAALQPGESARVWLDVSWSAGSAANVRGLGSVFADLIATDAHGTWVSSGTGFGGTQPSPFENFNADEWGHRQDLLPATASAWNMLGVASWGTYNAANGSVDAIQAGQIGAPGTSATVSSANPVVQIWRGMFTPDSYADRTISFVGQKAAAASGTGATLYTKPTGQAFFETIQVQEINFGTLNIPVVPSPSSLALLGLGGLVAARRRR